MSVFVEEIVCIFYVWIFNINHTEHPQGGWFLMNFRYITSLSFRVFCFYFLDTIFIHCLITRNESHALIGIGTGFTSYFPLTKENTLSPFWSAAFLISPHGETSCALKLAIIMLMEKNCHSCLYCTNPQSHIYA